MEYWSWSLTSAERSYDTTEGEFIEVVWEVTLLGKYLKGAKLTIGTDHEALSLILNMTDAKGPLTPWRLRLSVLDYDVVHCAQVKHQAADALSRLETSGADTTQIDDYNQLMLMTHKKTP